MADSPQDARVAEGALAATGALVAVEHLRVTAACPVPRYGGGAEYIEHLHRIEAWATWTRGDGLGEVLRRLDALEYPPLLYLTQLPADVLLGPNVLTSLRLQLGWVALLVAATVVAARALGLGRATAAWAGTLMLLAPAAWGSARLFYYDLPMAAWLAAAFAGWVAPRRGWGLPVAVAALAAAVLTRWEAVLYVVPLAGAAVACAASGRRRAAAAWIAGSAAAAALPVVVYTRFYERSAGQRWGQLRTVNDGEAGDVVAAIGGRAADALSYPIGLVEHSWGLVLTAAFVVALLPLREREPKRVTRERSRDAEGGASEGWAPGRRPQRERERKRERVFGLAAGWALASAIALLVAVSPIAEVRFVHPVLPVVALATAAGLARRRLARVPVLPVVAALAAAQLVLFDATAAAPPLGAVPSPPTGQVGWARPADGRCTDAAAVRDLLDDVAATGARRFALDPANQSLGAGRYVWDYEATARGGELRRVDDVAAADVVVTDFEDGPRGPAVASVPFVHPDDPRRTGTLRAVRAGGG